MIAAFCILIIMLWLAGAFFTYAQFDFEPDDPKSNLAFEASLFVWPAVLIYIGLLGIQRRLRR